MVIGEKRDHTARVVSKWVPDSELWDLVKLAWRMRAEGRSYGDIQKATCGKIFRAVNCWATFFRNKTYLGIQKFGDLEITDHHEPAITWQVWEAVQKLKGVYPRGLNHPRRIAYPSLLSGLAVCLECGATMIYHTSAPSDGWAYYICNKKDRQRHVENACKSRRVNEHRADKVILETVLNRILTPAFLEELIEETRQQMSDTSSLDLEINQKKTMLEGLDRGIQRLLDLVEVGDVNTGDAIARLNQRQAERARTESEIRILRGAT